jgi:hypothetical protein
MYSSTQERKENGGKEARREKKRKDREREKNNCRKIKDSNVKHNI